MKKLITMLSILVCLYGNLAVANVSDALIIQDNNSIDTSLTEVKPIPEIVISKIKLINSKAPFRKLSTKQLLALAIYGESRSENIEGKIAVGTVVIQRHIQLNKSIKSVILRSHQFSCFNPDDKQYDKLRNIALHWNNYKNSKALQECYAIAEGLLDWKLVGNRLLMENSVTHFKTVKVKPKWAKQLRFVCQIGGHQFYTKTPARVEYVSYNTIFIKRNILLSMKDSIENHSA